MFSWKIRSNDSTSPTGRASSALRRAVVCASDAGAWRAEDSTIAQNRSSGLDEVVIGAAAGGGAGAGLADRGPLSSQTRAAAIPTSRIAPIRSFIRSFPSRRSGGQLGAFLAGLGELLEDHVALQAGEVVDEEYAFEMVHLVLQADGEQAVQLLLPLLTVAIEPAGADPVGP